MNSEIDDREREDLRVEELLKYEIMGAPAEFAFDDIVDFATEITVPVRLLLSILLIQKSNGYGGG